MKYTERIKEFSNFNGISKFQNKAERSFNNANGNSMGVAPLDSANRTLTISAYNSGAAATCYLFGANYMLAQAADPNVANNILVRVSEIEGTGYATSANSNNALLRAITAGQLFSINSMVVEVGTASQFSNAITMARTDFLGGQQLIRTFSLSAIASMFAQQTLIKNVNNVQFDIAPDIRWAFTLNSGETITFTCNILMKIQPGNMLAGNPEFLVNTSPSPAQELNYNRIAT